MQKVGWLLVIMMGVTASAYAQAPAPPERNMDKAEQGQDDNHRDDRYPHAARPNTGYNYIVVNPDYTPPQQIYFPGYTPTDLAVANAHVQSLQNDIANLQKDIDLLDESSDNDAAIAADNAKIEKDQTDIAATQDQIMKIQAVLNANQNAR